MGKRRQPTRLWSPFGQRMEFRDRRTMFKDIESNQLCLQVDTQIADPLEAEEHECGESSRPRGNGQHAHDRRAEESSRTIEETRTAVDAVIRVGQQCLRKGPPHAASAMHGEGIEGIVHFQHVQGETRRGQVNQGAHHPHNYRELRCDAGTAGSDGDQAAKDTIARLGNRPGSRACQQASRRRRRCGSCKLLCSQRRGQRSGGAPRNLSKKHAVKPADAEASVVVTTMRATVEALSRLDVMRLMPEMLKPYQQTHRTSAPSTYIRVVRVVDRPCSWKLD
eukprot:scaffold291765_cov35-Tisochrysis_lutea.AAC.4